MKKYHTKTNGIVKRIGYWLCLLLDVALISCTTGGNSGYTLSAEDIRLEHTGRIDTLTLRTTIDPDTVEGWQDLVSLSAEAWVLIDDGTGCLISQKNGSKRLYMASLTKMMTCLLALEHGNLGDSIEITQDVFVNRDSRVRLGDGYLLGHLLYEMMLQSDNDAAWALAKHVGGDTVAFCRMMNEKAAYLRMDDTHFANPNGMPNDSNYSSARDLARLVRYSLRDSMFAQIVSTAETDVPLLDGRHMPCHNTNMLLDTYKGCIGVKTGYTRQAGYCLASAATRDGVTLVLVLLNSRSMTSRFTESATLLDYGFRVMKAFNEGGQSG